MNISAKKQSQFELFPGAASGSSVLPAKRSSLIKDLTLSFENIIVLGIVFIMISVLFFSWGVERGKKIALVSPDEASKVIGVIDTPSPKVPAKVAVEISPKEERVVFPVSVPEVIKSDEEHTSPDGMPELKAEKLFTIQVASFKLEENAQKEADRLKKVGHNDSFVLDKGSYSIVCVGKFMQMAEAKKFSNKLKNKYNDCLVRRL